MLRLLVGPGGDTLEIAFRELPAGTFSMGTRGGRYAEEPVHTVTIPSRFWMGETPITQAQFTLWRASDDYERRLAALPPDERDLQRRAGKQSYGFAGHPARPAENITWFEAAAYCDWLNDLLVSLRSGQVTEWVPAGHRFQLPSEAHWEYACRAASTTEYSNGDGEAALREIGHFSGNTEETVEVRSLAPNRWQLFDMHGNVSEWCADVWDSRAYRKRSDGWHARPWTLEDAGEDAQVYDEQSGRVVRARAAASAGRVLRGGSWSFSADGCRSAIRFWRRPDFRGWYRGFRVCLLPGPSCLQPASQAEA
jgi:formylglycine-generating enzyme required for sulfatase activity